MLFLHRAFILAALLVFTQTSFGQGEPPLIKIPTPVITDNPDAVSLDEPEAPTSVPMNANTSSATAPATAMNTLTTINNTEFAKRLADAKYSNDETGYDITRYTINVEPSLDETYLTGTTLIDFIVLADRLPELTLDFAQGFKISAITLDNGAVTFSHDGDKLQIKFAAQLDRATAHRISVSYAGTPPLVANGRIRKGLRWETHGEKKTPIIANLSTPFLAHLWFPCKDGTKDKADAVEVNITIADRVVDDAPFIGVSNGVLINTTKKDGKTTFQWLHNYPVVPYYVMMAVSNYVTIEQPYTAADGRKFPLTYYVFPEHKADATIGTAKMPEVMAFYESIFGAYPFDREKYGMTQLGFYSGIEQQTNSIVNNMGQKSFYTSIHELAHMWFADAITCATWQDAWLNEGFASYAEALWDEHARGREAYLNNMRANAFYGSGPLYLPTTEDPFQVFLPIVYQKGPCVLHSLRGVVGDEVFFKALKQYATSARRYHHARTADLQRVFEEVSGQKLDYFFDQWVYGEHYPEYSVRSEQDGNASVISVSVRQKVWEDTKRFFTMPLEVQLQFEDGTTSIEKVRNDHAEQTYKFKAAKKVSRVVIDPNEWILKKVVEESFAHSQKELFEVQQATLTNEAISVVFGKSSGTQALTLSLTDSKGTEIFKTELKGVKTEAEKTIAIPTEAKASIKIGSSYRLLLKGNTMTYTKTLELPAVK